MFNPNPADVGAIILPPTPALSALKAATAPGTGANDADKTATEFEAMALGEFISAMFTTPEKGMFSGGNAGQIYRSLLTQEYGKAIAKAGGLGIAKEVKREILKLQEVQKR
ncbi:MAG TPA: rod-binding protein [Alphaproteobacteria bacterium]|nr:rod-binding protein [Alphaproteobacteria bacterium]